MDNKILMKISNIDGEYSDKNHKNWIKIKSCSQSFFFNHDDMNKEENTSVEKNSAENAPVEEAAQQNYMYISKKMDVTSPKLALMSCEGEFIDNVKVEFHENEKKIMEWIISGAYITYYSPSAGYIKEEIGSEEISFIYKKIEWISYSEDKCCKTFWDFKNKKGGEIKDKADEKKTKKKAKKSVKKI